MFVRAVTQEYHTCALFFFKAFTEKTFFLPVSKTDALFTWTSILFVRTSTYNRAAAAPLQMETLYTEELCTDSRLNECQSAGDTLTRRWNVAIVRSGANRSREFCLSPISLVSRHFYIRRGLTDQWSFAIDFLTPSFGSKPSLRRLHPFPPLFANLYFFHISPPPPLALLPPHF